MTPVIIAYNSAIIVPLFADVYRYGRAEVVLALFRSIRFQSYAVESQIRKANERDSNISCCIQL
jgi:hypothetical protein